MKLTVPFALLCALPVLSFADNLAVYSMTGGADAIYDATEVSPLVTVTPITPKNLTKGSLTLDGENGRVIVFQPSRASSDPATTLSNQTYFSVIVSPKGGAPLWLDTLRFEAAAGGATATRTFRVFSSTTGFDAARELVSDTNGGGDLVTQPQLRSYTVDLKDPRFQSITAAVEFRFYVETTAPYQTLVFDNITITGVSTR